MTVFRPEGKKFNLTPWVCTYRVDGVPYGIKLYATDPEQIERDFKELFDSGVRVDGRFIGVIE